MIEQWSVTELRAALDRGDPLRLIDVRTAWEREIAAIEPSELLSAELVERLLAEDDGGAVVFYCHHGVRSYGAAQWFGSRGLGRPINLTGGIDAWSLEVDTKTPRY